MLIAYFVAFNIQIDLKYRKIWHFKYSRNKWDSKEFKGRFMFRLILLVYMLVYII